MFVFLVQPAMVATESSPASRDMLITAEKKGRGNLSRIICKRLLFLWCVLLIDYCSCSRSAFSFLQVKNLLSKKGLFFKFEIYRKSVKKNAESTK